MIRHISGLTVIGCPYCYSAWNVDTTAGRPVFHSKIVELLHRELDVYYNSGVFQSMGVPVKVEDINYQNYNQYPPYEGVTRNVSDSVYTAVTNGDAVLFAGGYCNYAPAVAGGLQRAIGTQRKIGIVWIDAHADCRIPGKIGSSTRLVSVPMAVLCGMADEVLLNYRENICGLKVACDGTNILASDIRILDEETGHNLISAGITKMDASEFQNEEIWKSRIHALAEQVDVIYMSIDADILKHKYIPSYDKNVPYGQELETVARNAGIVTSTGKVGAISLFCFNFDHYTKDTAQTYQSAITIMKSALTNWRDIPF